MNEAEKYYQRKNRNSKVFGWMVLIWFGLSIIGAACLMS